MLREGTREKRRRQKRAEEGRRKERKGERRSQAIRVELPSGRCGE